MSVNSELNPRHQSILKATVEHYIATAEPVGSKIIAKTCDLKISSATIRNVMGRLEAAGLLYQPHISSGRVPSDSGYRIYVDRLLIPDETSIKKLEKSLYKKLKKEKASTEALIQKASKILAALSGYIALITFPEYSNDTLRHLQLVPITSKKIMLILVTDSYQTRSILIESSSFTNNSSTEDIDSKKEELQILSNFLDRKFKGKSLWSIANLDWSKIDREFARYTDFFKILSGKINGHLKPSNKDTPIIIHGIAEVLHQPEFSQLENLQTLLYFLEEEQERLLPLIFHHSATDIIALDRQVNITIGSENPLEPMQIYTLISANYYLDSTPIGSVGVIGPTRMFYENTIALVSTTANYLSQTFTNKSRSTL